MKTKQETLKQLREYRTATRQDRLTIPKNRSKTWTGNKSAQEVRRDKSYRRYY